jgi:hypothetical protein
MKEGGRGRKEGTSLALTVLKKGKEEGRNEGMKEGEGRKEGRKGPLLL